MTHLSRIPNELRLPLVLVGAVVLIALLTPLLPLADPTAMNVPNRLASPSWSNWLGTDEYGRDVLSRLLWGARATLSVAFASAALAAIGGVTLALIGGYVGGLAEIVTIRATDLILSFPPILLALLVVTLTGPGALTLIAVLSILFMPGFARVAYGEVLAARSMEYVEASRALGSGALRIMVRTILPNIIPPVLVQFSLTIAAAIVIESGLSFLGLGVTPPTPSWGLMIRGARSVMDHSWLLLMWPCLALVGSILIVNRLCDALRDIYDPRTSQVPPPELKSGRLAARAGGASSPPTSPREAASHTSNPLLQVCDLHVTFETARGSVRAVNGVSFDLRAGEVLAIVGESGSGKSMTGLSLLGLAPPSAHVSGSILLQSSSGAQENILDLPEDALFDRRGRDIAMVFQEPMTSLNPVYRVGEQIAEMILCHEKISMDEAQARAVVMLGRVGIPDPERRARSYPHQLSGGMRQRVMIAMALACRPRILIADEPTTALDVTVQADILDLLRQLQGEEGGRFGIIFITHNLGVVAEIADRVAVMYAGRIVEQGKVRDIFNRPSHPYTRGLLASVPKVSTNGAQAGLQAIPGAVPSPFAMPPGCAFAPRCRNTTDDCQASTPDLVHVGGGQETRCARWREL